MVELRLKLYDDAPAETARALSCLFPPPGAVILEEGVR
jgi:hypothetical protein